MPEQFLKVYLTNAAGSMKTITLENPNTDDAGFTETANAFRPLLSAGWLLDSASVAFTSVSKVELVTVQDLQ